MGEDGPSCSDDYDPHGDPKADPRERRRIRYEYRELIAETQSKHNILCRPSVFMLIIFHVSVKSLILLIDFTKNPDFSL